MWKIPGYWADLVGREKKRADASERERDELRKAARLVIHEYYENGYRDLHRAIRGLDTVLTNQNKE